VVTTDDDRACDKRQPYRQFRIHERSGYFAAAFDKDGPL
jgi:hypothetical protein